jgi:hypothetical protein
MRRRKGGGRMRGLEGEEERVGVRRARERERELHREAWIKETRSLCMMLRCVGLPF